MTQSLMVEMKPKTQKLWDALSRDPLMFDQDDVCRNAATIALQHEAKHLIHRERNVALGSKEVSRLAEIRQALALVNVEVRWSAEANWAQWHFIGQLDWYRI